MADKNQAKLAARLRRKKHIRKTLRGTPDKPRMVVFRSLKHIYAQLIDDEAGHTLLTYATNSQGAEELLKDSKGKKDQAFKVGKKLAELAIEKGFEKIVFDRGGCLYHGRIKAIAEGARKGGLKF